MADLYSQLGVARGADEAAIKKAYRKLAKELHPDRNKENPQASERFSKVTRAYDILSDKDKRAQYDRGEIDEEGNPRSPFGYGAGPSGGGYTRTSSAGGPEGFGGGEAADLSDLFEGLFGGATRRSGGSPFGGARRAAPPKGADAGYRLSVPFEDAAALKEQRVTLPTGKTISIKLPPGVESGAKIRLAGQGHEGPGGTGDAIVTIDIAPHAFFKREGDNIRLELPVSLDEAVLGAKVKVPTVDGAVMVGVPAGSSSGKTLRLKGKGFTGKAGRGDQLVTLMIDLPAADEELKSFVEHWSGKGARNPRAALGV